SSPTSSWADLPMPTAPIACPRLRARGVAETRGPPPELGERTARRRRDPEEGPRRVEPSSPLGLHLFPASGAGKIDGPMDADAVLDSIPRLAAELARSRAERQRRRELDPRDFAALRDAGFHRFALPAEHAGLWRDVRSSARPLCRSLRA